MLSKKTKDLLTVAMANAKAAKEVSNAIDSGANPKAASVAAVTAANAIDLATAQTLSNANKVTINALLAALKAAGLMST